MSSDVPPMSPLEAACRSSLHFVPGSRYEYCTLSFYILAELVARLSGLPLERYLRQRVLDPLGMGDTSFDAGANPRAVGAHGLDPEPERSAVLRGQRSSS